MAKAKKPKDEARAPGKPGRPSKYSEALVESICERLSKGEPLAAICRDEGMPADRTVRDWIEGMPEVSAAIARAREEGFDAIAHEALAIADDGRRDYVPAENGGLTIDHDHIARSRLRVDTRLKLLAKWDPKRYGDRIQHANDPNDPMPAPQFIVQPVVPKSE